MSVNIYTSSCLESNLILHASGTATPINRNGSTTSTVADQLRSNTHTLYLTSQNEKSFFVRFYPLGFVPTGALTGANGALLIPGGSTVILNLGNATNRPGGQVPWFWYENVALGDGKLYFDQLIGFSI